MSVDTPESAKSEAEKLMEPVSLPQLRREALLPNERSRGLGTVAVVCTMAGVASGLALATTLMAMQVADSMTVRTCPYRVVRADVQNVDVRGDHGFLGIRYVYKNGAAEVLSVLPNTPASTIQLRPGDHVISIDGAPIRSAGELQDRIYSATPGTQPSLVIEREGAYETVRPTLSAWPNAASY